MKENKVILKQWAIVLILILVLGLFSSSIYMIFKGLDKESVIKKDLYSYNYSTNMNYRVYLKNNKFFDAPYLGMNKQYIASIIDRIEVDVRYNFQSTKDLDYNYSYEIVATTKGLYETTDGKDVEVWSKAYPISNLQTQSGSGKDFSISKTVTVDYNTYNDIMTDFRNQFGLSIDARVDLTLRVNITAGLKGSNNNTLQSNTASSLKIPLLKQTVQISSDALNGSDTISENENKPASVNVPLVVFGFILLIISVILLKFGISSLLKATRKSEYILTFNKILKEYGDIIAETGTAPSLSKYDVIEIKNFDDLVDVEEELHSPIICCETRSGSECLFVILNGNTAYKFVLRDSDFEHIIRK